MQIKHFESIRKFNKEVQGTQVLSLKKLSGVLQGFEREFRWFLCKQSFSQIDSFVMEILTVHESVLKKKFLNLP